MQAGQTVRWGAAVVLTAIIIVCMVMLQTSNNDQPTPVAHHHQPVVQPQQVVNIQEEETLDQFREFETLERELKSLIAEKQELLKNGYGGSTLLSENRLVFQNYTPSDKHAIVTMIGCSSYVHSYWMGGLALIQSLREVQTRVPNIVVMIRRQHADNIPDVALKAYERLGAQIIDIASIKLKEHVEIPGTWEGAFDKLTVWSLTQYEKALFLDADTLIVQNIDHLLNYPELTAPHTPRNCYCHGPDIEFETHPEYFTISSGFFIAEPSEATFHQMLDLASKPSPDPDDVAQFGGNWHWGDQEMLRVVFTQLQQKWNTLDWVYDLPVGLCSCPKRRTKAIYSYHFVCSYPVPKPWSDTFLSLFDNIDHPQSECMVEIYMLWYRMLGKALGAVTSSHLEIDVQPEHNGEQKPVEGVFWN